MASEAAALLFRHVFRLVGESNTGGRGARGEDLDVKLNSSGQQRGGLNV
jgi:hypothetical protein